MKPFTTTPANPSPKGCVVLLAHNFPNLIVSEALHPLNEETANIPPEKLSAALISKGGLNRDGKLTNLLDQLIGHKVTVY